ncbi:MAG: hypothetical protein E7069_02200 [Bacteroidales bacterium]|nr:hypothetical protein [Bacteroidales bacterium]
MHKKCVYILLFVFMVMLAACEREYKVATNAASLTFAIDTLSLDTVFTGQTTPIAKVCLYNHSDDDICISRISLDGAELSPYVVNINGFTQETVENIRLRSSDSLYIFVSLKPVATSATAPIRTISDGITVTSGSCTSHLTIIAYALSVTELRGRISSDTTLTSQSVYLITDSLVVESGATLSIEQGVKIYMSNAAQMHIYGSLNISGSYEEPVVIRQSRLDEFYNNIPSQWGYIYIHKQSRDNIVNFAQLNGATYGFVVDSTATFQMYSSTISHVGKSGVVAASSDVEIGNSLLFGCGGALVEVSGGSLIVEQSTLAGYYAWDIRKKAALTINADDGDVPMSNVYIANSIICGSKSDEVEIDSTLLDVLRIENSIVRLGDDWSEDDEHFSNVSITKKLYFADIDAYDYHITEESPALDAASPDVAAKYPFDLDGMPRSLDAPDIGAFEFIP